MSKALIPLLATLALAGCSEKSPVPSAPVVEQSSARPAATPQWNRNDLLNLVRHMVKNGLGACDFGGGQRSGWADKSFHTIVTDQGRCEQEGPNVLFLTDMLSVGSTGADGKPISGLEVVPLRLCGDEEQEGVPRIFMAFGDTAEAHAELRNARDRVVTFMQAGGQKVCGKRGKWL